MPHSTWMWQVHRLNLHEITLLSDCSCRLTYLKRKRSCFTSSWWFPAVQVPLSWMALETESDKNDWSPKKTADVHVYIYTCKQYLHIYISFHTYHAIFAKGQWLRVRERVPLLPLLFRSPSPCGEKCFLFVCPTYKYKVYVSCKTFGGQGP